MTPDQLKAIRDALNSKRLPDQLCIWCGTGRWRIKSSLSMFDIGRMEKGDAVPEPEVTFPLVLVSCSNCGYTMFFDPENWDISDELELNQPEE